MADSTRILIERIQDGDATAREELYARCQLPVLFLVRVSLGRKLRRKVDSWDIVQEALLKSLNDLSSFRFERDDAFRRYLYTKVQQVIRDQADFWSAAKRNPGKEESMVRIQRGGSEDLIDLTDYRQSGSPSELVSLDEDLSLLAEAMDQLSVVAPEAWELIVAVKLVGNRIADVATEREVTPEAIKMRVQRGMLKLCKYIDQWTNN